MKIGLVTGEYPPMQGGISTQTRILAERLAQQGNRVCVYTSTQANEVVRGVDLCASAKHWGYSTLHEIDGWARQNQLDVVNMHFQTAAYKMSPFIHFLPQALRQARVPVVTTFHDLRFPYLFPKAGDTLRKWIVMHLARTSAGVVATNQEDYKQLQGHRCATLIPIASNILVAASSEKNARDFVSAAPDELVMAFFGFVNRMKGLEDVLRSMVELRSRGVRPKLLMVGDRIGASDPTNIPYAQEIERMIETYDLKDAVRWTGYVNDHDVRAYLLTADAVVLPYRDGSSYRRSSLIVALHHGAAVVTTEPIVPVPAFEHGKNMLLTPRNNVQALTSTLLSLYKDAALQQHLRQGALSLANLFSWDHVVADYCTFYQKVAKAYV